MKEGHQLESLFEKYDMVFKEDLGTLQSATATLHVKPNATFKFFKPHPVPYAIRESVELELDRLELKTKWKVILSWYYSKHHFQSAKSVNCSKLLTNSKNPSMLVTTTFLQQDHLLCPACPTLAAEESEGSLHRQQGAVIQGRPTQCAISWFVCMTWALMVGSQM